MMQTGKITVKTVCGAVTGIFLVGTGVAFNNRAGLGNDPIGILYDGMRVFAGLSDTQLGTATNIVNLILLVAVFIAARRYINIGTFIYLIPYGFFVDLGGRICSLIPPGEGTASRVFLSVIGCLLLYLGIGVNMTMDIGVDPFVGMVLAIADKTKRQFRVVKVATDIVCVIIGALLGGKLGIVTVITALAAGPIIQFFAGVVAKVVKRIP